MLIDDNFFCLKFNTDGTCLEASEPSDYLYETNGSVIALDEEQKENLAGKFRLYYIDVGAATNAGESVFDVFDSDAVTFDYFRAIFESDNLDISDKLSKLFNDDLTWGNVLILDRLELLPSFRNHNMGLLVMRRLIERFSAGSMVVAIKPFPLQFECADVEPNEWKDCLNLSDFTKDNRQATAKLRRHYAKLGFKAMKTTPFMFRASEYPLPLPNTLRK
jgi:hypothetical protein